MNAEGNMQSSRSDSVELLRTILQEQNHRSFAFGEAEEVGNCLIGFYELLAMQLDEPSHE